MITVTLAYPNNMRREVILAGIPRVGETIRPADGPTGNALIVEAVVWMEGGNSSGGNHGIEPTVLIFVRPRKDSPTV